MKARLLILVVAASFLNACAVSRPANSHAGRAMEHEVVPVVGQVYGAAIRARDAEELRYYVLRALTDRYASEHRIVVTADEVAQYNRHVRETLQAQLRRTEVQRDAIRKRLAEGQIPVNERKALAAEIQRLDQHVADLADIGKPAQEDSPEVVAARQRIGAAFVLQWKINRALYGQYGGRVAFQQGGPEPVDAYRRFLEKHLASGDFAIADPGMSEKFWRYYTDDARHRFFPAGKAERAFSAPPFLEAGATQGGSSARSLSGTAWQLIAIQSMDDAQGTTRIAQPLRFTLRFESDGRASLRLDCNRGTASWQAKPTSGDAGTLSFGPVAVTRALCAPPRVDERVARDLPFVRSFLLEGGRLYMSLMADGGIYEWAPLEP